MISKSPKKELELRERSFSEVKRKPILNIYADRSTIEQIFNTKCKRFTLNRSIAHPNKIYRIKQTKVYLNQHQKLV